MGTMSVIARVVVYVTVASTLCQGHSNSSSDVVETERNIEVNPSTTDTHFDVASFFSTPVASNLASLIANAVKSRRMAANITSKGRQDEVEEDIIGESNNSSLVTTTEEDPWPTTSHVLETEEGFQPASADQFGNLGDGSKLVDLLPDISQYSLDASGLVPLAGAGAVALVALGAILAVPVAPIILRRTGSNGWGGLPSWKTLFNWWSSPDPTAEAWADNYYQGYGHGDEYPSEAYVGAGEPYYNTYDTSSSGSSIDSYYTSHNNNNQHTEVVGQPGGQVQKHNPTAYTSKEKGYNPAAAYPSKEKDHNPAGYQNKGHAYHNTNPPTFHNHNPPAYQTHHNRPNRRQGDKKKPTVDGYEYVTLEQINRIGDESVRVLSELVNNYGINDLYAFRDGSNQLQRRRLPSRQQQPQPSHQETQGYAHQETQGYPNQETQGYSNQETQAYAHQETQGHYQTYYDEAPEDHPHRDTISLVEPEGDENESKDASSEPHPYRRHQYSFAASTSEVAGATKKEEESSQAHKVSEFPYEFHKEN
ncbi:uncharacterized protein [Procambarus clarkii]|uniref:uncharacterized protein n=1 Tax=Procambarus clarkii TaxID=6728 RepID=UPI003742AD49